MRCMLLAGSWFRQGAYISQQARTVTTRCLQAARWPLDISTFPGDHQVLRPGCKIHRLFLSSRSTQANGPGSYSSTDHGITGRLRPRYLILGMFKILYLDGLVSRPTSHSFGQSDCFNKLFGLTHGRLLAPGTYCVDTNDHRYLELFPDGHELPFDAWIWYH